MLSDSLKVLFGRIPQPQSRWVSLVLGALVGLAVPVLAILGGHIVQALDGQPLTPILGRFSIASFIPTDASPLAQVVWLLVAAAIVAVVASVLLYLNYHFVQRSAVEFEVAVLRTYRDQVQRLSQVKPLSAQQRALVDDLEYHLPRVRGALARYWQAIPRHVVQFLVGALIGVLIHWQFALLAAISVALAVLCYQWLDRTRRMHLPVVRESAARLRGRLVNVCLRGPLMQAVHDAPDLDKRFDHVLELYQRDAVRSLTNSSWKVPLVATGLVAIVLLLVFVMAIQGLRDELTLPAAVTFLFCLLISAYSARRLMQIRRELRQVEPAGGELVEYLSTTIPEFDQSRLSGIDRVSEKAELQYVTVQDSQARKLLEDVLATFDVGTLTGVFSDQPLPARTLAELLVGLGRPTSGRLLFDGRSVLDLKGNDLTRCGHWAASDGGILTGTLAENIGSGDLQVVGPAMQQAELNQLMGRLAEGFHTLITHDDDRFLPDEAFRVGLARAILATASIVVIEEPDAAVPLEVEEATLDAIKQVAHPSRIAIVLAQRLSTLRHCDRVLFIHDHRLVDSGKHAELVQRNELYRHLTYLKFNPFR